MTGRAMAAVSTMVLLAALDLGGAMAARRYAEHRSAIVFVVGTATFATLFAVYAHSLRYAELSTITFGWVAMLQIGVVVIDRSSNVGSIPPSRMLAMAGILVLEAVLLFGPRTA